MKTIARDVRRRSAHRSSVAIADAAPGVRSDGERLCPRRPPSGCEIPAGIVCGLDPRSAVFFADADDFRMSVMDLVREHEPHTVVIDKMIGSANIYRTVRAVVSAAREPSRDSSTTL